MTNHNDEIEEYGTSGITSKDSPIPRWLILTYLILPVLGIIGMYVYWNGSHGFLDPGHWHELQKVANTTLPEPPPQNPQEYKYP